MDDPELEQIRAKRLAEAQQVGEFGISVYFNLEYSI